LLPGWQRGCDCPARQTGASDSPGPGVGANFSPRASCGAQVLLTVAEFLLRPARYFSSVFGVVGAAEGPDPPTGIDGPSEKAAGEADEGGELANESFAGEGEEAAAEEEDEADRGESEELDELPEDGR